MLQILLHSSKTMRDSQSGPPLPYQAPQLLVRAEELAGYVRSLDVDQIATVMKLSSDKAASTMELMAAWSRGASGSRPAIDAFIGDIYSGLQVHAWTHEDRDYANAHLLILSGLYGGLRACDSVAPYRLEMGYRLPSMLQKNLYQYWGDTIATLLDPRVATLVNLSAVEYTKALLPYIDIPVVTPRFLTVSPKTGEPTFVVVHAKIARGAFAKWLIVNRIENTKQFTLFDDLGYRYDASLSAPEQPVYVCREFGGIGLSVRLS